MRPTPDKERIEISSQFFLINVQSFDKCGREKKDINTEAPNNLQKDNPIGGNSAGTNLAIIKFPDQNKTASVNNKYG